MIYQFRNILTNKKECSTTDCNIAKQIAESYYKNNPESLAFIKITILKEIEINQDLDVFWKFK